MKISRPGFEQVRVRVAGDLMLDRHWHGATDRFSLEAPCPSREIERRPGGAGNVALNLAALGAVPGLVGVTGADEAGVARYVEDTHTPQAPARSGGPLR